jgi:outer membrane protein TolC
MNKLFLIMLLGISFPVYAQTNQPITLSLQQAMKLGLQNRFDVKADQYNIRMAKNKIHKRRKAWIPDIHAEGKIQYNTQIQSTYVPKGFAELEEPGLLSLGAKNSTAFGLTLTQPLFKPGIHTNVKIAKANLSLQKEKFRGVKINIKYQIATAYLNVLLKKLQYRIAKDEQERFKKYKTLAAGKHENGALIKNDYMRAKLDYKNSREKTNVARQNYRLSLKYLKYQMNIPNTTTVSLSDSIGNVRLRQNTSRPNNALENRTEIKQLRLKRQKNELQLKSERHYALPTVSVFGYYAQTYQNQNFRYNESKWWAPHSYVGLKFSIPITGNIANNSNVQRVKLKQQQTSLAIRQKTTDISYQVQKATIDLENDYENMQTAKANYDLSQNIYINQKKQFKLGVFHYSDLLDTERSLRKAEQSYIKAVYDYLTAKIQYEKAVGDL